ncbi:MAG: tetratricopeptide repeat protein [Vicinamibacterales bacterium]
MSSRRWSRTFIAAYALSGIAGLIYQVTWTRMMTLLVGHTTAAVTAVVAGFMAGLAVGSSAGASRVANLSPARALRVYAIAEAVVAAYATLTPLVLPAAAPLLRLFYADGGGGSVFIGVRTAICLAAVALPAAVLGVTFPLAVTISPSRAVTAYSANTAGAAFGALLSGFVLLPTLGLRMTMACGVAASCGAAVTAWRLIRHVDAGAPLGARATTRARAIATSAPTSVPSRSAALGLLATASVSGFATLLFEVAWSRAAGPLLGPSTYAFAGTVATMIVGLALGSALVNGLTRPRPNVLLACALPVTAAAIWYGTDALGTWVPVWLAQSFAAAPPELDWRVMARLGSVLLVMLPGAVGLGLTFPLIIRTLQGDSGVTPRAGLAYGVNAASAVAGALVVPFAVERLGVEGTLVAVPALLLMCGALVTATLLPRVNSAVRIAVAGVLGILAAGAALTPMRWDLDLLARGVYKYSRAVNPDLDVASVLKAGELLYYRDGSVATVSVTRFAGRTSLAIDGKVDGSSGGDMLTQTLAAQLPLLVHGKAGTVLVVGLGTGVTAAAAATHPASRIDVVEISKEVVAASRLFSAENRQVLDDPRVHLIVGDARSHLALSAQQYDVIISEPSNPWLAGVAALFTHEAFVDMRRRLAPGGIVCQWVHTYDISEEDFRSIIATFREVFPLGTLWTIGDTDMLLVAGDDPLDARLPTIERGWTRPAVAGDLARVEVRSPFALVSLFAGGPEALRTLAAGATRQTDDRMALEFTAPRAAFMRSGSRQSALVHAASDGGALPDYIRALRASADAVAWTNRAAMYSRMGVYVAAFDDYARALNVDDGNSDALLGLATTAVAAGRVQEASRRLAAALQRRPLDASATVAMATLLSTLGDHDRATRLLQGALANGGEPRVALLEALAALHADTGNAEALASVVTQLENAAPGGHASYYRASVLFMRGAFAEARQAAERARQERPRDPDTLNLLGAVQASQGDRAGARLTLREALQQSPADASIYVNLGLLELEAGRAGEAARQFTAALALEPENTTARAGLRKATQEH